MDKYCYGKIAKLCKGKSVAEVERIAANLQLTTLEWLELRKLCGKRNGLYNLKCRCMVQAFLAAASMADLVAIAEQGDFNHRVRALKEIAKYPLQGADDVRALRNSKLSAVSFLGWYLLGGPDDSRPVLGQIIRI